MPRGSSAPAFERLSALDATSLALEDDLHPMHVVIVAIFDAGPLRGPDGALDRARLRTALVAAVARLPRFRRRLGRVPLIRHPVLLEDPAFDVDRHVRFATLPRGDESALKELVARIASECLDRARPLWEMWCVDGLDDDSFAIVAKAHQCLADGVSGIPALSSMLRPTPDTDAFGPVEAGEESPPTGGDLLRAEGRRFGAAMSALGSSVKDVVRASGIGGSARDVAARTRAAARGIGHLIGGALTRSTRREAETGRKGLRTTEWLTMDLGDVLRVKDASGATMNDLALAILASAVRRSIERRGGTGAARPLRVLLLANSSGTGGDSSTHAVSLLAVSLPLSEPDPRIRVRLTIETVRAARRARATDALPMAELIADHTFINLATVAGRLAARRRPFDAVLANVPGPGFPLYLLGARLRSIRGFAPAYARSALSVSLVSYAGQLSWGIHADSEGGLDVSELVRDLGAAFEEIKGAVLGGT